jgi:hypothetical protein
MDTDKSIKKISGALAKGVISQIPIVGPLTVELLNVTIPNQRQERIEKLLNLLSSKVFDISPEELEQRYQSTDFIDLYEDVFHQSLRATTQERIEYLASILSYGVKNPDFDLSQTKRVLDTFAKVNDVEVIILQSCSLNELMSPHQLSESLVSFEEKYSAIFKNADKRQNEMISHYVDNLINIGLIGPYQEGSSRNFLNLINSQVGLRNLFPTHLGYMLLDLIGIPNRAKLIGTPINPLDVSNELMAKEKAIVRSIKETKENAIKQINAEIKKAVEEFRRQIKRL